MIRHVIMLAVSSVLALIIRAGVSVYTLVIALCLFVGMEFISLILVFSRKNVKAIKEDIFRDVRQ